MLILIRLLFRYVQSKLHLTVTFECAYFWGQWNCSGRLARDETYLKFTHANIFAAIVHRFLSFLCV